MTKNKLHDVACKIILLFLLVTSMASCSLTEEQPESGDAVESEASSDVAKSDDSADDTDEDFEEEAASNSNMDIDKELSEDETSESPTTSEEPTSEVAEDRSDTKEEVLDTVATTAEKNTIKDLKYLAHSNGGTVAVSFESEVTYNVRKGRNDKQYVVEFPNSNLPERFKRPYITNEFDGPFVSFEAYQSNRSNTARLLIQQKFAGTPSFKTIGTVLYISGTNQPILENQVAQITKEEAIEESAVVLPSQYKQEEAAVDEKMVLRSKSLYEYLSTNSKFYGKKMSLEVRGGDVRDVLGFIAEQTGLNMVVDDQVQGKITMKLTNIPWDQALLTILQTKRLGYLRQGNVLRISPLINLKEEAEEATTIMESRKKLEDLTMRIIQVSYAKVEDLERQTKGLLSQRGTVSFDKRTSSLVVTDIASNLDRIEKLVKSLDSPPPQVLIEGKVVEATDTFERAVGMNLGFSGAPTKISSRANGPVNLSPSLSISPALNTSASLFSQINVGTLNFFGDISASLALYEVENKVKVLSSPRITTLHNEQSQITQTQQVPIITAAPPTTLNGTAQQQVTYKELKLELLVTPQITADESVVLDLDITRDVPGDAITKETNAIFVNSRRAKTKVLVKSGQTAVIGGIYQNDNTAVVTGVPLLKDIPILGYLFKSQSTKSRRTELLIFLTPRILAGPITSSVN